MNQHRHFFGQTFLKHTATRVLLVFLYQVVYHLFLQTGENLDIAGSIIIAHVEPELIELVRCSALGIEPDVATLCLTKLLAVGLGDKRTGEGKSLHLIAQGAANEFSAGGHISPLVVAS